MISLFEKYLRRNGLFFGYAANSFSMTLLVIAVGSFGSSSMAADLSFMQAVMVMVFQSFSGNARQLAMNSAEAISIKHLLKARIRLMLPLAAVALLICPHSTSAGWTLAVLCILRSCSEWLSELRLCHHELRAEESWPIAFAFREGFLLVGAFLSLMTGGVHDYYLGFAAWAIVPGLVNIPFLADRLREASPGQVPWSRLAAHFGSTISYGVLLFVFRAVVIEATGKPIAGRLFTAYAIGSLLCSISAVSVLPKLIHYRIAGIRTDGYRKFLFAAFGLQLLAGSACTAMSVLGDAGSWKDYSFLTALGLSFYGGAIMLIAQYLRIHRLQTQKTDLFRLDVVINLGIFAATFVGGMVGGAKVLQAAFLVSATIHLVVICADYCGEYLHRSRPGLHSLLRQAIVVGLFVPVFFQISSGIYRTNDHWFAVHSDLLLLPLPFSLCFAALGLLLLGGTHKSRPTELFLAACFIAFVMPPLIAYSGQFNVTPRMLLALQSLIPFTGLMLGQMFASDRTCLRRLPQLLLWTVGGMIALHVVVSLVRGRFPLDSYVAGFSVYGHRQYVSTVLVTAFMIPSFVYFARSRALIPGCVLGLLIGVYAMGSFSRSAVVVGFICFIGSAAYAVVRYRRFMPCVPALTFIIGVAACYCHLKDDEQVEYKLAHLIASSRLETPSEMTVEALARKAAETTPDLVDKSEAVTTLDRSDYWLLYVDAILNGTDLISREDSEVKPTRTEVTASRSWFSTRLWAGRTAPPDSKSIPSAHNYYLDSVYNFGLTGIIPLVVGMIYTLWRLFVERKRFFRSPLLVGLTLVVLCFLLVDNNLKVTLRQPYSGLAACFLWGVLLTSLQSKSSAAAMKRNAATDLFAASTVKPMRVLILSQYYDPEPLEKVHDLAVGLRNRGHDVEVLTAVPCYPAGKTYPGYERQRWMTETRDEISILRVPQWPGHSRSSVARILYYVSFAVSATVYGLFRIRRPDVIYVYQSALPTGYAAWLLGRAMRVPFVLDVVDPWPESVAASGFLGSKRAILAIRWAVNFLYVRANRVNFVTKSAYESAVAHGCPDARLSVIRHWPPAGRYAPVKYDPEFAAVHGMSNRFNVLFAGNIGVVQDLQTLIEAAELLCDQPEIQFIVVGNGIDADRLRGLIAERQLPNIRMLGAFPPSEMPKFFASADLLLVHLRPDPLSEISVPSKTYAYLASGRPILMAVAGEAANFVRDHDIGLTVPPSDPVAMAEVVRDFAAVPSAQRRELGEAGRRFFNERLCSEVQVPRMERLLAQAAGQRLLDEADEVGALPTIRLAAAA